ncbi:bifunctional methylenetetrahydrofolate dehydrogenase/methenyltetrahydrofolate cyclohydrolase FolD [Candidatus Woesearchaeota archaeon]|nr:bifunctional methylenetetrahydrofolate dehydrogenase/methenyltetrahydrofolate cyclohydrolase FolD [Candidatus Woesearchaeota archaeon]
MQLIDGKKVAAEIREKVKEEVSKLEKKPGLAVILVGEDPASKVYVNIKDKKCKEVGIESYQHKLDKDASEEEVLALVDKLNKDDKITGILVQMPLPSHISSKKIMNAVLPEKDADGFHPMNIGKMMLDEKGLVPCTPRGVMKLFDYYNINLEGKEAVVIGNSVVVGNPIAQLMLKKGATVTVCHIKTKDLKMHTIKADIIVSAVGKRNLVTADMVKEGAVIIDVGIVRDQGKLYGDVDFENVKDKCSYITPVPGGVGPMTVACLLENTMIAYNMQKR